MPPGIFGLMKLMRPFYVLLFVTGVTEMLGSAALDAGTGTAHSHLLPGFFRELSLQCHRCGCHTNRGKSCPLRTTGHFGDSDRNARLVSSALPIATPPASPIEFTLKSSSANAPTNNRSLQGHFGNFILFDSRALPIAIAPGSPMLFLLRLHELQ